MLRTRTPALLALAAVVLMLATACGGDRPAEVPTNAPEGGDPTATASDESGENAGALLAEIGNPSDLLPEPAYLPIAPAQAAQLLARQVLTDDEYALPALLTALQRSGISVYGPDDQVAVTAAGPDQGLYFEAWQVRSMVGVVGQKQGGILLPALFEALVASAPELKDEPFARYVVEVIQEQETVSDTQLSFWARFIVELGKARPQGAYDMRGDVDPEEVELDVVQVALITQRLQAELSDGAGVSSSRPEAPRTGSFAKTVSAAEPCQPTGPRPKPKVTTSIFGSVVKAVNQTSASVQKATIDPVLRPFAESANLLLMLNAVKVEVEMEGGPLLERTKTTRAGERKKLKARVSFDGKLLEWANCYRAWENSRGRDLKWPPGQSGPVADVPVTWVLVSDGSVSNGLSARDGARGPLAFTNTNAEGIARTEVEGEPQKRDFSPNAKEKRKKASAEVAVKLKLGDLIKRSERGGVEVLNDVFYDQEMVVNVSYPFEVMDWSDGPGKWTGAMSRVSTTIKTWSNGSNQETWTSRLEIKITETVDEQDDAGLYGSLKGRATESYTMQGTSSRSTTVTRCGRDQTLRFSSRDFGSGSGEGVASVSVTVSEDGQYIVGASTRTNMSHEGGHSEEEEHFGGTCEVSTIPRSDSLPKSTEPIWTSFIQGVGTVDPKDPNTLKGESTKESNSGTVGNATKFTETITWSLTRE